MKLPDLIYPNAIRTDFTELLDSRTRLLKRVD